MLKKLDSYIIKTFFGPFLFIFSVLFFIFLVNIVWTQIAQFTGKGLSTFEIIKLLFYSSLKVVQMVLPLTILLAAIMTFGGFGERYELVAMKSSGISLFRIMRPLFLLSIILSILLFFFSNTIIPQGQRKGKNMLFNILSTKPAVNFTPGQFIQSIPGFSVKFDKIQGEKGEKLEGVFLHKEANSYQNNQTIIAEKGRFTPAKDPNYLKLTLYNGYVFEDQGMNKDFNDRLKQTNQSIQYDSLIYHFDVSELLNNAIDQEKISENYQFEDYFGINHDIATLDKEHLFSYEQMTNEQLNFLSGKFNIQKIKKTASLHLFEKNWKQLEEKKRLNVLLQSYNNIDNIKKLQESHKERVEELVKSKNIMIMWQQRIFSYSVTCLIFFIVGASLGSIIRKGGMGLPIVVSIIVYIVFYLMSLSFENWSWKGQFNPYLAAWCPNLIFIPACLFFSFKALRDSQIFDIEKYKTLIMPLIRRFKKNQESTRYQ